MGASVSSNMLRGAAVSAGTCVPIPPQPSMYRARAPGAICTFRKLFELRFSELTDCLRALGSLCDLIHADKSYYGLAGLALLARDI
jgi:hypothetical protein